MACVLRNGKKTVAFKGDKIAHPMGLLWLIWNYPRDDVIIFFCIQKAGGRQSDLVFTPTAEDDRAQIENSTVCVIVDGRRVDLCSSYNLSGVVGKFAPNGVCLNSIMCPKQQRQALDVRARGYDRELKRGARG